MLDVSRLVWRRWAGRHPTGIDRVCLAYLEHFGDRAQAVVQHPRFRRILTQPASKQLFHLLAEPGRRFRTSLVASAIRHAAGVSYPGKGRLYLNIGHTGLDNASFAGWTQSADMRPVYLVHDLIPITHPEFCRAGEQARHVSRIRTMLQTATGIIGNSGATLDELRTFALREGLSRPPEIAAWLGSTPLQRSKRSPASDQPTFVVLGTIEGRKNHLLLLHIWTRLVARLGESAPRLLIIGQRGWEAEQVYDILDRGHGLRDHVVEMNGCSDEEVAYHLSCARALLFPTMAEGFGLPLVEALGLGVPVIASDLPVFREIGGDIPTFLDPIDGPGWEEAILDFATDDSAERVRQLRQMKDFSPPSWKEHFEKVENWLPTLA